MSFADNIMTILDYGFFVHKSGDDKYIIDDDNITGFSVSIDINKREIICRYYNERSSEYINKAIDFNDGFSRDIVAIYRFISK